MNTFFKQIPDTPETISSTNSIARMIDGIGFRYYWATENLTDRELEFSPGNGSMNITELNLHIYDLAFITHKTFGLNASYQKESFPNFITARKEILSLYESSSKHLKLLNNDNILNDYIVNPKSFDGKFPFWYLLNGHIADCLTHIGQITSWRRISGNPQPKVNVFLGKQLTL